MLSQNEPSLIFIVEVPAQLSRNAFVVCGRESRCSVSTPSSTSPGCAEAHHNFPFLLDDCAGVGLVICFTPEASQIYFIHVLSFCATLQAFALLHSCTKGIA